jgi:uncharacterized membrane protein YccC
MKVWTRKEKDLPWPSHALRTAAAAAISLMIARLVGLPEAYWAAISTLVVMQSTLEATLMLAIERIVASAMGAWVGAINSNYFGSSLIAFAISIFLLGLLSFAFRLRKTAFRYAGVTLAIVVLVPRTSPPFTVAWHRFVEVALGILVGLAVAALWPERESGLKQPVTEKDGEAGTETAGKEKS